MNKLAIMETLRKAMTGRFCTLKLVYIWLYCKLVPADQALMKYKGIHEGEKCFIIGTAPSLTVEDLELVKQYGVPSFSCNSIIKLYDRTEWRPTYFMVFDPFFYRTFQNDVDAITESTIFYNQIQIPGRSHLGIAIKGSPEHLVREYKKHNKKKPFLKLSTNLMDRLIIGQSTLHSAIAVAVWMGFKEIYLLGIDCDYSEKQHADGTEDVHLKSEIIDGLEMIQDYKDYKPQLEALGVRVVNCSRGEKLKVFPCEPLESVLGIEEEK